MQVNSVTLTSQQELQLREIVVKSIDNNRVFHPYKFDFHPHVIENVIALANKWFLKLAEKKDQYEASFTQVVTSPDKVILKKVFAEVFNITIDFDYSDCDIENIRCTTVFPKGLQWRYPNTDLESSAYKVNCSWFLGNPFLFPETQKPAVFSKTLAAEAYKEELTNVKKIPTDFILKVGETTLSVHRFKLACHSHIFFTLFNSAQFKEASAGELIIPEHSVKTVLAMIAYIYTGELDHNADVIALIQFAHQYEMKSLVIACEEVLSGRLSTQFEKIYEIAVNLQLENLLPFCLQHIAQDKKCLQTFINSITADNFVMLYQSAHSLSLSTLIHELTMWQRYNATAKNFEFSIQSDSIPDTGIDCHHQPGQD